jgi:hypothetical protein
VCWGVRVCNGVCNGLGHNVARVGTVWHNVAQFGGAKRWRLQGESCRSYSAPVVILAALRRATLVRWRRSAVLALALVATAALA